MLRPGHEAASRLLMDLPDILLLVAAGVIGGIISSIAGGAALFIFPALLATGQIGRASWRERVLLPV